jgi:hypothetical protein
MDSAKTRSVRIMELDGFIETVQPTGAKDVKALKPAEEILSPELKRRTCRPERCRRDPARIYFAFCVLALHGESSLPRKLSRKASIRCMDSNHEGCSRAARAAAMLIRCNRRRSAHSP